MTSLKHVFNVEFALDEAVPTVSTVDGDSILVKVNQGTGWSLNPEQFPFKVIFEHGHDDIFTAKDGQYSRLDCVVYGHTEQGGRFILKYDGVMRVQGVVADILGQKENDMNPEDGYVTANMKFQLDNQATKEIGWVNHYNLVGRAKFSRKGQNNNGQLVITYNVYALV